jgi:PhzF family phenazine biosynthesis protein
MEVLRVAAFAKDGQGGNPAGVVIGEALPAEDEMLAIARQVGYSETAFLSPVEGGWRVRYFAPEMEVPFCGHATIASGAVLGERFGEGEYRLFINAGEISVQAERSGTGVMRAALQSPATWSQDAPAEFVEQALAAFGWTAEDVDPRFPVRFAFAGAKHLVVVLKARQKLAGMRYPFEHLRALMQQQGLVTIDVVWPESDALFHARNPFPTGGVVEDPATGAAAAALAGYLRDIGWPGPERFEILQGEDMGSPSRLVIEFTRSPGASVKVSGDTRRI